MPNAINHGDFYWRYMFERVLDIIFPPKCGFCGKINKEYLCKKCELKLDYLKKDKIRKMLNEAFSYLLYGYEYKEEIRKKILDFKFSDKPELANTFVKLLLNNKNICGFIENYDIMIPVPMYKKKQIMRGYNQTELIAKRIAENLHLDYAEDVLTKIKNTETQSNLDAKDRQNNVKNAYECKNMKKIYEKKVILFDDIFTTGSTAAECSKQLRIAGSKEIAVLTVAKD